MTIMILDIRSNGDNRGETVTAMVEELAGQTVSVVWYRGLESREVLFQRIETHALKFLQEEAERQAVLNELMNN
ncbi:MAG: hypothetical protein HZA78_10605 [Candidatus Schekmanbacteria bacterium]|nr:hypothetical protein [Candidatus Schekmanbacteria bacterium]